MQTLFIPKIIKVGYQNREGTYTGKLAYIIYYDEKQKVRKEGSWESWRHKTIEPDDFENIPTQGFVLNKKAGGYISHWNMRQTYCRVYDPRGFEFEITIQNLLFILENTNSIKGKGLEGEFVYSWSGPDIVLLPVNSIDYKHSNEYSTLRFNNTFIKAKDLQVQYVYQDKHLNEYIYLGKHDYYNIQKQIDINIYHLKKRAMIEAPEEWFDVGSWESLKGYHNYQSKKESKKRFVFYSISENKYLYYKAITKMFIKELYEYQQNEYNKFYLNLFNQIEITPIKECKIIPLTINEFINDIDNKSKLWYYNISYCDINNKKIIFNTRTNTNNKLVISVKLHQYSGTIRTDNMILVDTNNDEFISLFNKYQPCKKEIWLINDYLYETLKGD